VPLGVFRGYPPSIIKVAGKHAYFPQAQMNRLWLDRVTGVRLVIVT
jgi:hypothetical protein